MGNVVNINGVKLPIEDLHLTFISKLIGNEYGFLDSSRTGMAVDGVGKPLPLYTYPCIEYLTNIDFKNANVFEWGCGNSSLWWLAQGVKYYGVDTDIKWINIVKNVEPEIEIQHKTGNKFVQAIDNVDNNFDVIVIDGGHEKGAKYRCVKLAVERLNRGGIIILDNSDMHRQSKELLDSYEEFIPVHFNGLRSITVEAITTSCYVHREFNRKTIIQTPIGGIYRQRDISDEE
jgi:hypothetical protein